MSIVTRMIDCPRLTFEAGKPVECGCEVEVEIEIDGRYIPASRWDPAEYPSVTLLNYPDACPETNEKYTPVELKEMERRGDRAADRVSEEGADNYEDERVSWKSFDRTFYGRRA